MTDFIISFNFSCQKGTLVFETAYFDQVSDKTSTGLVTITHILEEEKSSKHLSVSESFYVKKKLSHCSMYQVSSRNTSLKPVDKTY